MVETLKQTQSLKGSMGQYSVNTGLLVKAFADIKDEDVFRRPEGGNSLHWIAGHVTDSRMFLGELTGLGTKSSWGELFNSGCEIKAPDAYPPLSEVISTWKDIGGKLMARFGEISDEELGESIKPDFPGQDKTVLGAIAFLSLHESYHVGQLAYIRRLFGYERLTG